MKQVILGEAHDEKFQIQDDSKKEFDRRRIRHTKEGKSSVTAKYSKMRKDRLRKIQIDNSTKITKSRIETMGKRHNLVQILKEQCIEKLIALLKNKEKRKAIIK